MPNKQLLSISVAHAICCLRDSVPQLDVCRRCEIIITLQKGQYPTKRLRALEPQNLKIGVSEWHKICPSMKLRSYSVRKRWLSIRPRTHAHAQMRTYTIARPIFLSQSNSPLSFRIFVIGKTRSVTLRGEVQLINWWTTSSILSKNQLTFRRIIMIVKTYQWLCSAKFSSGSLCVCRHVIWPSANKLQQREGRIFVHVTIGREMKNENCKFGSADLIDIKMPLATFPQLTIDGCLKVWIQGTLCYRYYHWYWFSPTVSVSRIGLPCL